MKPKFTLLVEKRRVPTCRRPDCDDITHQVRVSVYLDGRLLYAEKELKTYKRGLR